MEPGTGEVSASEVFKCLVGYGERPSSQTDWRKTLDAILHESRQLAEAEAGSLYVLEKSRLRFLAAQNDRMEAGQIDEALLGREINASSESLAGYVANVRRVMNIPDADHLPPDAPFQIHRELDAKTGFRARSILAIPLSCPDGRAIGVLELFNRIDSQTGRVTAFPDPEQMGLLSLASLAALTIHNARLQHELRKAHLETVYRLSAIVELRDYETSDHIQRVSNTSRLLAEAMGLDAEKTELIELASPMHDIGKVVIPDAILRKPGPLTAEERNIVEQHPLMGAQILGNGESELVLAAHDIALTHHERWDGQGYPQRLAGEQIPLCGRVVAVADVLDALLTRRSYKEALGPDHAAQIVVADSGRHFDPQVVQAFRGAAESIFAVYAQPVQPAAAPAPSGAPLRTS